MEKRNIDKMVDIKNGKLRYSETEAHVTFYTITYFIEDGEGKLKKSIKFNMWDDFSFSGYIKNDSNENNSLEFEIEEDNIIYNSINNFLGKDTEISIEDDESRK